LFVNVFDLYKNMYKSLIEMYAMSAVLFHKEKQKSTNNFVLILKSHETNFKNIIIFIHTNIKISDDDWRIKIMIFLHTNMKILDDDCQFKIKNIDKLIWTFVIVFLSDMKQQQESVDFFESRVTKSCRFCNFDANNRKNLSRDTIANEKYHFEMKKLRRDISRLFEITKIKTSLVKNDLVAKLSIFEKIISTLNIIMSFSFDFAHSEYYELIRRLYSRLEKSILISREFEQFNDVFQNFSFSFEWNRIQFSAIHMSSWSMNECAKTSVIISVLLRCWLRSFHIRKVFETDLLKEFLLNDRRNALISMNIIISCFVKLTKNNCFIFFYQLFEIDRLTFNEQILNARINILKLMNAENKEFIFRNKISNKSRDDDMFCDETIDVSILKTSRSFYFISKAKKNEIKNHLSFFSNYHIKIHFQRTMKEYDVLWNINVLFDEDKHRFFKQVVLIINNKKSKRQFLFKNAVRFIVKTLISETFVDVESNISSQLLRLQKECSNVLKNLNHVSSQNENDVSILKIDSTHLKSNLRERIRKDFLKKFNLFTKMSNMKNMNYESMMRNAMNANNIQIVNWNNRFLWWYEECFFTHHESNIILSSYTYESAYHWSFVRYHFFFIHVWKCLSLIIYQISFFIHVWKFFFTDHFVNKCCTFHINDFVKLVIDEYAQILFIYSQTYNFHVFRRIFVWLQHLETFSYMNEILQLQIFRIAEHQRIISLTSIFNEKVYFVKITKDLNNKDFHEKDNRTNILHCN
jgi:hypothetical protein